jgi:hypothetical protein
MSELTFFRQGIDEFPQGVDLLADLGDQRVELLDEPGLSPHFSPAE